MLHSTCQVELVSAAVGANYACETQQILGKLEIKHAEAPNYLFLSCIQRRPLNFVWLLGWFTICTIISFHSYSDHCRNGIRR